MSHKYRFNRFSPSLASRLHDTVFRYGCFITGTQEKKLEGAKVHITRRSCLYALLRSYKGKYKKQEGTRCCAETKVNSEASFVSLWQDDEALGSIHLRGSVVTAVEYVPDGETNRCLMYQARKRRTVCCGGCDVTSESDALAFIPICRVSAKKYDVDGNLFEIITSDEIHYFLQAATGEERKEWIKAIQAVSKIGK